jgi:glycerol-3-phosphate dehydrogenase subunit C
MSTTYDPTDPLYFDERDMRAELDRVFDLCHGCRMCFYMCTAFPTLFDFVDQKADQQAHLMTPAEQDRVVEECFHCKMCEVKCPYTPAQGHEWALDFPRLMLRATAIRKRTDGRKLVDHALARTDLVGTFATLTAPVANKAMEKPGSPIRKLVEKVTGISAQRVLPPYAKQRFSSWFKRRTAKAGTGAQGKVAVFPTCLVEYQRPDIGQALVGVYEHNGVSCNLPDGIGCCGAPWLHAGDFDKFREQAAKNIPVLARAVRDGHDVVVPQPTCGYVLKKDYPAYMKGTEHAADAELVGEHTFDSSEYLWRIHKAEGTTLSTDFTGNVPPTTTYHAACHLQAQNIGLKSRDLMKLTGTKITVVAKCSGIDGTWGYRAQNYDLAKKVAKPLGEAVTKAAGAVVTGDCHLANGAIAEETGQQPIHPLVFMARAYGLPEAGR